MKQNEQIWIEAYSKTMGVIGNIVSAYKPADFANAVNELSGPSPDYTELKERRNHINNATGINLNERERLLTDLSVLEDSLRDKEIERKKMCAEILDNHMYKVFMFVVKIGLGLSTGGVTWIPDIYKAGKGLFIKDKDLTPYDD